MIALICTYTRGNHCVHVYMHVLAHVCICTFARSQLCVHMHVGMIAHALPHSNHSEHTPCACLDMSTHMHHLAAITVSMRLVHERTHKITYMHCLAAITVSMCLVYQPTHKSTCMHCLTAITMSMGLVDMIAPACIYMLA